MWTDDPHFNPHYHIRHTALPQPADEAALKRLAGRLFSQRLDRSKPLWEIWLVRAHGGRRFALIAKTHHALVDGISGVDITTVLFDTAARAGGPPRPPAPWSAQPLPGLGQAARRGAARALDRARRRWRAGRARVLRAPAARARRRSRDGLANVGATTLAGHQRAGAADARSTSTSARTAATPGSTPTSPASRRSRTRSAARSTTSCSPPSASRSGATCARTATTPRASC